MDNYEINIFTGRLDLVGKGNNTKPISPETLEGTVEPEDLVHVKRNGKDYMTSAKSLFPVKEEIPNLEGSVSPEDLVHVKRDGQDYMTSAKTLFSNRDFQDLNMENIEPDTRIHIFHKGMDYWLTFMDLFEFISKIMGPGPGPGPSVGFTFFKIEKRLNPLIPHDLYGILNEPNEVILWVPSKTELRFAVITSDKGNEIDDQEMNINLGKQTFSVLGERYNLYSFPMEKFFLEPPHSGIQAEYIGDLPVLNKDFEAGGYVSGSFGHAVTGFVRYEEGRVAINYFDEKLQFIGEKEFGKFPAGLAAFKMDDSNIVFASGKTLQLLNNSPEGSPSLFIDFSNTLPKDMLLDFSILGVCGDKNSKTIYILSSLSYDGRSRKMELLHVNIKGKLIRQIPLNIEERFCPGLRSLEFYNGFIYILGDSSSCLWEVNPHTGLYDSYSIPYFSKITTTGRPIPSGISLMEDGSLGMVTWGWNDQSQKVWSLYRINRIGIPPVTTYQAFGWGKNSHNQYGKDVPDSRNPTPFPDNIHWKHLSAGYAHCLGIDEFDNLYGWGFLFVNGARKEYTTPQKIGDKKWEMIVSGNSNSLAIDEDGFFYGIGKDYYSKLPSQEQDGDLFKPVQLGPEKWKKVALGSVHAFAIRENGDLYGWGWNDKGALGDGTTQRHTSPVKIGDRKWKDVTCGGSYFSLGITEDGDLYGWGNNTENELGHDGLDLKFHKITDFKWKCVSAGNAHVLAITEEGDLYSWGRNVEGQTGHGKGESLIRTPRKVGDLKWNLVESAKISSYAITEDGYLYAWGSNNDAQLGDGSTGNSYTPTAIGYEKWVDVSAGHDYAIGLQKETSDPSGPVY